MDGVDGVSVSVLVLVPVPAGWESPLVVDVEDELLRGLSAHCLHQHIMIDTHLLESFFFKPTARPTASAMISATIKAPMRAHLFQPRRLLLPAVLSCVNFSLLGVCGSLHTLTLKLLPL